MTGDKHLNLFYTYNRDNQLIENNLTRAWIVTLDFLSGPARDSWMHLVLKEPLKRIGQSTGDLPSFVEAQFALQNWMDKTVSRNAPQQYLLTIAGDKPEITEAKSNLYSAVPDGWVYDPKAGYCLLVEAKLHYNPLDEVQIKSHAWEWLGLSAEALTSRLLAISWFDVARSINQLQNSSILNVQEKRILTHLAEYLAFFGYRLFSGFDFAELKKPPQFELGIYNPPAFGHFQDIPQTPTFRLMQSA